MLPKLGFSLQRQYDRPIEDVIALLKEAEFSAVSPVFSPDVDLSVIDTCVHKHGMLIQSIHAPLHIAPLWQQDNEASDSVLASVIDTIDTCARFCVPVMVLHSWQGLSYTFPGEPLYYEHFDRLVTYALEKNVSIAFENLEGEEYLAALMTRYGDCDHVGFCWDSGHENCYPHTLDFLQLFGDRLIMTHLNDNLGLRDPGGIPAGEDDLHYLPGDGKIDWAHALQKLSRCKIQNTLNFELKIRSKSKAEQDLIYDKLSLEAFIMQAGMRARQFAQQYMKQTSDA